MNGLFKYFPVDLYKVEKLARHQILLTPPKYFNDPWDFRVQREPITDDEARTMFKKFQGERPSDLTFDQFKTNITRPEYLEQEGPDMQHGLSKMYGVVSLTVDPYSRLMWAYYSDSHRGFVAEFANGIEKEALGHRAVLSPFGLAVEVAYELHPLKLKADFSNSLEVYSRKHVSWRHENEWRIIELLIKAIREPHDGKTFYLLNFKPEYLVRVIFGLHIDPKIETRLLEMFNTKEFAHVKKDRMKIDVSGELVLL